VLGMLNPGEGYDVALPRLKCSRGLIGDTDPADVGDSSESGLAQVRLGQSCPSRILAHTELSQRHRFAFETTHEKLAAELLMRDVPLPCVSPADEG
jgi:hypothetical protein